MHTTLHHHPPSEVDLARCWHLLLRKSWVVALTTVAAIGAASVYLSRAPKIYSSTATIEVEPESRRITSIHQVMSTEFKTNEGLKTVEQSLMTASLMLRVIEKTGLRNDPCFRGGTNTAEPISDSQAVCLFDRKLTVALRRGTRLIDVTVEDPCPERAQELAKAVVEEFLRDSVDQRLQVARSAGNALQKEADQLKLKVEQAERRLQAYREEHNAVSLEDKQNIIVDRLKDLNEKATAAKQARLRLESDVNLIQTSAGDDLDALLTVGSIASDPEVESIRKQIREREAEFSSLKERYLELHPKYIQAETYLKDLGQALQAAVARSRQRLLHSFGAAKTVEQKLAEALKEQEKLSLELHSLSIPYNVLAREVEADRALYAAVLNGLKETSISRGLESNNIRIIDDPIANPHPQRPRPAKVMAVALLAGVFSGVLLIAAINLASGEPKPV